MSSDTAVGISKSTGLGLISFGEAFEDMEPDLCLVLGDRFETFAAAAAATIARLPIAHIHGGETTEGAMDEALRHSITKMSHLHFTSTEDYRERVIQLGEHPDRVWNTGAPGLENVHRLELLDRETLQSRLSFELGDPTFLVTYHPVTLEKFSAGQQADTLLGALEYFPKARIIFTLPNADTEGRVIIRKIRDFVADHPERSTAIESMGQVNYLSALKHVDAVIGNSSSGLIEAPSFDLPTVNIGNRQRGRVAGPTVIHCGNEVEEIRDAIEKALDPAFRASLEDAENPYEGGRSSEKIVSVLKEFPLDSLLKKSFYDLPDA